MDRVMELLNELYAVQPLCTNLSHPENVVVQMLPYRDEKTEHFLVFLVDNKNNLVRTVVHSSGTVDQTPVYPREVVRCALLEQVSGLILGHNHPGGDPKPSIQDQEMTQRVKKACDTMDIRMLDHVIIARNGHFSFQQQGIL